MKKVLAAVVAVAVIPLVALGCKKDAAQDPSTVPNNGNGYNNGGYNNGGYNNGYNNGGYSSTTGGYTAPANTTPANPLQIVPCSSDAACGGMYRCNTAVGKCAGPCSTSNDCMPGYGCAVGACIPGAH